MTLQRHQFYFTAMATPCELQLYGTDKKTTTKIAETAISDVHRIEQSYSRNRNDNLMYQINQAAAQDVSIGVDKTSLMSDKENG
jgi:thiamine biosynthesis lipoprotein